MIFHATRLFAVLMFLAVPTMADDAKPAPAAVRAKAVVIKKAAPAAAVEAKAEAKVETKAAAAAPAKAPADAKLTEKPAPARSDDAKPQEAQPAAKPVAAANLKGFGKNEAARKPAPVAAAVVAQPIPVGGMVAANAGLNDAQLKQITEQYKQQLQPILASELSFIRLTCDIPKENRKAVLTAGRECVNEIALKMAEQQNRGRGGVRVAVQSSAAVNDPPKAIRAALDTALKAAVSEEQYKVYRDEATHRKEQIKQAAIHSVIARLDGMLCLTAEVRKKMAETISENWQESYERWLQIHQYGDQYFPTVPDQLVSVHLNPEQRQIWTGLQKIGIGGWGNNGGIGGGLIDDGWWGEAIFEPGAAGVIEGGAIFIDGGIGF